MAMQSRLDLKKGLFAPLALLLALVVILASCGGGAPAAPADAPAEEAAEAPAEDAPAAEEAPAEEAPAEEAAEGEKVLIIAVDGDIDTFDPCCTVGSKPTQTVLQNTFDQLTQYAIVERTLPDGTPYLTVDTDDIVGMMAEEWSMDEDGVVTFNLREGLTWHNGEPVTAQSVVDGYNRIFEVGGNASFLLTMGGVNDASYFAVVDDLTLTMAPDVPNNLVNMNNVMHNTSILAPGNIAEYATDSDPFATEYFRENLAVGNGPFLLEEYVPGDRIVLRANEDYYAGPPALDRVIMKIVPDAQQRVLLLQSGEVDMILIPPVQELDRLQEDANINVISVPSTQNRMLMMNVEMEPFNNQQVRHAIAHAVPYDLLIEQVWFGRAQPLQSPIANGTPTSDFSFWDYDYDLERAAELLAEAGYPDGEGLPPITLSIRIGTQEDERAAIIIQDSLSQIGMDVTIEPVAFAAFNERVQRKEMPFWIDEWISWVNDPFYHLSWLYRSDSPSGYTRYNNPEVDELIATYTLWNGDAAEREEASRRIQELVVEDLPVIYLAAPNFNMATRSNVSGYVYYNDELTRFYPMDKSEGAASR
ncbi:MAG: ABC transporter substrate-binding protein [Chloroflexaceae bacterium]|nr:ABC transporter substrate-binding protein [Chloroflexaceae bacterium]